MAILGLIETFKAKHGTKNVRTDEFKVELRIKGNIITGFVKNIDYQEPQKQLLKITKKLNDTYLDDIVGRATNENIASYIIYNLNYPPLESLTIYEGTSSFVQIQQSELDFKNYPAQLCFNKAQSLLLRENPSAAINELTLAINLNAKFAEAYNLRGRCYKYVQHYQLAQLDYQMAVNLNPDFGEAHRNLGNIYDFLNKDELMIPELTKAVNILKSALAFNNRGYAFKKLGDYESALKDHNVAIELDPNYAEAYSDRAAVHMALGNTGLAAQDIKKAEELRLTKKDTYADVKFYC